MRTTFDPPPSGREELEPDVSSSAAETAPASRDPASKRRQIIDGAASVFNELGYDGASMSRIAEHAAVSKGTLYNYFEDRDALLAQAGSCDSLRREEWRGAGWAGSGGSSCYRRVLAIRIGATHGGKQGSRAAVRVPAVLGPCDSVMGSEDSQLPAGKAGCEGVFVHMPR